jgi:hypothetical protein
MGIRIVAAWLAVLAMTTTAYGAAFTLEYTADPAQETILLQAYTADCQDRVAAGKPALPGCDQACTSCTPNRNQKEQYLSDRQLEPWFRMARRAHRREREGEVCRMYRQADDVLRAQIDPVAGLPPLPAAASGETYQWVVTTTPADERTIKRSLTRLCEVERSSSRPLPENCTADCECTPAPEQQQAHLTREAVAAWFAERHETLRARRADAFCATYPELDQAMQDEIDALFKLSNLR